MLTASDLTYDLTRLQPDTRYIISVASTVRTGAAKVLSQKETITATTGDETPSSENNSFFPPQFSLREQKSSDSALNFCLKPGGPWSCD